MREAFDLSPKERLLLDERLYTKIWKSPKEKPGDEEKEEEEEEEEEVVTAEELAKLVDEQKLMGRDLRSVVRTEEFNFRQIVFRSFFHTLTKCWATQ